MRARFTVRYTYDALQVFLPPRRAGKPGGLVDGVETVRQVALDDFTSVLGLAGQSHVGHSLRVQSANQRRLVLASRAYAFSYNAPAQSSHSHTDTRHD